MSSVPRDSSRRNPVAGRRLAPLAGASQATPSSSKFASSAGPSLVRKRPSEERTTLAATTGARRPSTAGEESSAPGVRTTSKTRKSNLTGVKPRQPLHSRRAAPASAEPAPTAAAASGVSRRTSVGNTTKPRKASSTQQTAETAASPSRQDGKARTSAVFRRDSKRAGSEMASPSKGTNTTRAHRASFVVKEGSSEPLQPVSKLPFAPFDKKTKYYTDSNNWNTNLPIETLEIMDGRSLEPPFTTLLWTQAYPSIHEADVAPEEDPFLVNARKSNPKGKLVQPGENEPAIHRYSEKLTEGYYGCARCAAPLFSPNAQILYRVCRGMAAFQYINLSSVTVEIQTALTSGGADNGRRASLRDPEGNGFTFVVCCKYCEAFIGNASRDIPPSLSDVVKSGEFYVVNSCCLAYMKYQTSEDLFQIIAKEAGSGEEMEEEEDLEEDMFELVPE